MVEAFVLFTVIVATFVAGAVYGRKAAAKVQIEAKHVNAAIHSAIRNGLKFPGETFEEHVANFIKKAL